MTTDTYSQTEDEIEHPADKPVKAKLHPVASESTDDLADSMKTNTPQE